MDIEEMKVYIDTLEKENAIFKERNDRLYELNCNQARLISNALGDTMRRYDHMVQHDHFGSAKSVYNQIICSNTTSTTNPIISRINYI
jgi:hypothetical protein